MIFYPSRRNNPPIRRHSSPRPLSTDPGDATQLTWMLKSFVMGITLLGLSYWLVQIAGVQYLASLTSATLLAFLLAYVVWCLLHKNRLSRQNSSSPSRGENGNSDRNTSEALTPTPPPPFDHHHAYKFNTPLPPRDSSPPPTYEEALRAMMAMSHPPYTSTPSPPSSVLPSPTSLQSVTLSPAALHQHRSQSWSPPLPTLALVSERTAQPPNSALSESAALRAQRSARLGTPPAYSPQHRIAEASLQRQGISQFVGTSFSQHQTEDSPPQSPVSECQIEFYPQQSPLPTTIPTPSSTHSQQQTGCLPSQPPEQQSYSSTSTQRTADVQNGPVGVQHEPQQLVVKLPRQQSPTSLESQSQHEHAQLVVNLPPQIPPFPMSLSVTPAGTSQQQTGGLDKQQSQAPSSDDSTEDMLSPTSSSLASGVIFKRFSEDTSSIIPRDQTITSLSNQAQAISNLQLTPRFSDFASSSSASLGQQCASRQGTVARPRQQTPPPPPPRPPAVYDIGDVS